MQLLHYFTKSIRLLATLGGYVAGLFLLATTALILAEIGSRLFLGRSTRLAEEFSGYFLAATILVGAAYTLASNEHIRILILRERLSEFARRWLDRLALAIGVVLTGVLVVALYLLFHESLTYSVRSLHPSRTPMAVPHGAVLVGAALLWLQFLALFIESWFPTEDGQKA
jgi:TRAP-type C4-dicarboxylate transport system permease small subunit